MVEGTKSVCSGQVQLATALAFFLSNRSDSFDVKPAVRRAISRWEDEALLKVVLA